MKRGPAIVLIGFMGSGKSSVSRHLAIRTGWPRYDTDEMVTARVGMRVAEIFAQRGEEEFRILETEALGQLPAIAAIVATGGGIVQRSENVLRLRTLGLVTYLMANEERLFARASRRGTRPLLKCEDPRATFSQLLCIRDPLYRAAADFTLDTSHLGHEEVAEAILAQMDLFRRSATTAGHE